jgi:hypothetical protein
MKTADKDEKKAILDGLIDLFGQNRRWLLFFGTGTSCALDKGFGMLALADHLKNELSAAAGWPQVASQLASGLSLEQALTGVGLCPATKTRIQQATGNHVAAVDRSVRNDLLLGKKRWAGERLLKALTQRLPPRNPRLPVVTANYDMLIEYACAFQGIRVATGFLGDLIRVWNWEGVQDSLNQCQVSRDSSRTMVHANPIPRVELYKVHGSINRFSTGNGQVECDLWAHEVPVGYERVIAAPGEQKYEQYAGNIETAALGKKAQGDAMAFAVIGYGFNDPHLHQRILARVQEQDCPLLVMTLDLADAEIGRLRKLGTRVWILVAPRSGAGKSDESRTVAYMPGNADPFILDGERLWSCDSFAEEILGG